MHNGRPRHSVRETETERISNRTCLTERMPGRELPGHCDKAPRPHVPCACSSQRVRSKALTTKFTFLGLCVSFDCSEHTVRDCVTGPSAHDWESMGSRREYFLQIDVQGSRSVKVTPTLLQKCFMISRLMDSAPWPSRSLRAM